jgi:hypothetical protein
MMTPDPVAFVVESGNVAHNTRKGSDQENPTVTPRPLPRYFAHPAGISNVRYGRRALLLMESAVSAGDASADMLNRDRR